MDMQMVEIKWWKRKIIVYGRKVNGGGVNGRGIDGGVKSCEGVKGD